jgi:predicted dehydrogenase
MNPERPVRVGVIGRGFGARVVAPVFEATDRCEVVDVVTPRDDDAVAALCARGDVDLISVHSPPFLHLDHVRRAVAHGHAVLCDKPFGRNLADAQAMYDLAADAGVVHLVNFEFRRHPVRRELRRLLREGVVGTVEHLQWNAFHGVWRDPARRYGWSFDAALGGGWIPLSGSHTIDFLRWSLGEIVDAVGARRMTIAERPDDDGRMQACSAEDGYTALLRTDGGASVTIDATSTNPVERPNRVTVIGSDGVLELTNENPREEDARIVLYGDGDAKELFAFEQGDTYVAQMHEWAGIVRDSVRRRAAEPDAPSFADGLGCSRVMDRLGRGGALRTAARQEELA